MTNPIRCGQCGAVLPAEGEPCPRCLLATGFETGDAKPLGPGFLDDLPLTGKALLIADKYRVLETIGRGGMGVVYKAWQENLERVVAVKMVSVGAHAGPEEKARFLREAKTAARLQDPGIVAVYDWGEDEGVPFYSMEYIEGRDLAVEVKDRGPLDPNRAAVLVKAVAAAVAYAHGQQVLHRDLKPQNLLLTAEGRIKITDFGLAKRMDVAASFTGTGQVLGTAGYMAPEQAGGGAASPAVDIYGLGAVLYHLLTGRAPFVGNALGTVLAQVQREEPLPVRGLNASVPADLETICLKCLAKEPRQRYATAQLLAEELGRFLRGEPILGRPLGQPGKMWRACRRHPSVSGLAAALVMAVFIGTVGMTWQWRWIQTLRERGAKFLQWPLPAGGSSASEASNTAVGARPETPEAAHASAHLAGGLAESPDRPQPAFTVGPGLRSQSDGGAAQGTNAAEHRPVVMRNGGSFSDGQAAADLFPGLVAKIRIGIAPVRTTKACEESPALNGRANDLRRVIEEVDGYLASSMEQTRVFTVIALSDPQTVRAVEGSGDSGRSVSTATSADDASNRSDYFLATTLDHFSAGREVATFTGQKFIRHRIRLSAQAKIYNRATGELLDASAFNISPSYVSSFIDGIATNHTDDMIRESARQLDEEVAKRLLDVLFPAKVVTQEDKAITINRGDGMNIRVGEIWNVFGPGKTSTDPEVMIKTKGNSIGTIRITAVELAYSKGEIVEDKGIVVGALLIRPKGQPAAGDIAR